MSLRAFVLFASLLLSAPGARAGCDNLRFQNFDGSVNLTSDPFPTVFFRVRRDGNDSCSYFVTCGNGGPSSYLNRRLVRSSGGQTIPVQLCLDGACAAICKHYPEISSSADVITGSFPSTNNPSYHDRSYRPKMGALDYPRFGTYEEDFTFRLYEGTVGGSTSLADTETVTIRYTVSKAIDLSLVDTGAAFDSSAVSKTLNLGNLSTGKTGTVDLVLKFNAGFRVRLASQNAGKLKRAGGTQTLTYSLTIDGASVPLSTSTQTVLSGSGVSPAGGRRMPMVVTMGTVDPASVPGTYTDVLTLTVQTTE